MHNVLTPQQMNKTEEDAFNSGIAPLSLMTTAAEAVFEKARFYKKVLVVAFSGNNGGDGLATASMLKSIGITCHVRFFGDAKKLSPHAMHYYEKCRELFIENPHSDYDLVIDAVFGIGFKGTLSGEPLEAVRLINSFKNKAHILSIDIPSGLNALTGECEYGVFADTTITFHAVKQGLIINKGADHTGELTVSDIGLSSESSCSLAQKSDVLLPPYKNTDHKGTRGHVGIIGGAFGMEGATMLASLGALKTGAGKVSIRGLSDGFSQKPYEVMVSRAPFDEFISDKDVIVFGTGAGRTEETKELLDIVLKSDKPLIIDADGLYFLSAEMLSRKAPTMLTPHLAEGARLFGVSVSELCKDPVSITEAFTKKTGSTVILKSNYNLISDGNSSIFTAFGAPGMATAGSGDVLAGILAGAAMMNGFNMDGALLASFIHGTAGSFAQKKLTAYSMTAGDIAQNIFEAFLTLEK